MNRASSLSPAPVRARLSWRGLRGRRAAPSRRFPLAESDQAAHGADDLGDEGRVVDVRRHAYDAPRLSVLGVLGDGIEQRGVGFGPPEHLPWRIERRNTAFGDQ